MRKGWAKMNIILRRLKIIALIPLFMLLASSPPATGIDSLPLPYPIFQKGMSYVTWSKEGFSTPSSDESLGLMSATGVNCVAVVVTEYQEYFNSTDIIATDRTPSEASLRHAIRKAHGCGMYVMLKPHIDLIHGDGNSRSDIGFNSEERWDKWFANYLNFIDRYLKIAEEERVEFFCIGTELSFASTRKDFWKNIVIPHARKNFRGQILYAANWDEYDKISFWDGLDYIGIDAYFPLSNKDNPSIDELRAGWKNWLGGIAALQKKTGKPVVFTECGYCSIGSAARKPWEEPLTGTPNAELQANCYKAMFETFWDKGWFFGVYWWNWNTYSDSGGIDNRRFTPQNKPALEYVKLWYRQLPGERLAFTGAMTKMPSLAGAELKARMTLEETNLKRAPADAGNVTFTGELATRPKSLEPAMRRK